MRKVTLDMQIPNGVGGWTLAQAVESAKSQGLTRLLRDEYDISEHLTTFWYSVDDGRTPTTGQVLAAYWEAASSALDDEYYADDSTMTPRQYAARKAAITRLVMQKKVK